MPTSAALTVVLGLGVVLYFPWPSIDSDGDGILDSVESAGWRTAAGAVYVTDPHMADTDGDGLTDGEEAGAQSAETELFEGASDPTRADSDDDGLGDKAELVGWSSTRGETYVTDPMNPDTDGDGLPDGMEAGPSVSDAAGGVVYAVVANPLTADSDGDEILDVDEIDLSIDAFSVDSDGDGLGDAEEVALGTAPELADTDADGFSDGYEVVNADSQGLDPLWPDVKIEPSTYAWDFAQGAVLGELAPGDSLAWLAGNLSSGSASFIPGIGWVVGGAADLRDAIGSAIHADWVGAGFSVVGLIPAAGDAAAVPAKVGKFVLRHPELAAAVGGAVVALKWVPDEIKVDSLSRITPNWEYLRTAGFSNSTLLRLQEGRTSLNGLAVAMNAPGHIKAKGGKAPFLATGWAGEEYLSRILKASNADEQTQIVRSTLGCVEVCNATARRFDVLVDGIAHESKVGRVYLTPSIERQIRSDAFLVSQGEIAGAQWHFMASSQSNTIGPTQPVLDLLNELNIPYTIHVAQ